MDRGIYPILSGAVAQERRMQVFANNMANVNTAGFKQDDQTFQAIMARITHTAHGMIRTVGLAQHLSATPPGAAGRVFVAPHGLRTAFESGRIRITGNPLDLALQNRGFFEIKTQQGIRYTRNGTFSLDNQRRLVTNQGYPVLGTRGEIKIPPGVINVNGQGEIQVDGKTVATIKLVDFPDQAMPTKQAEGLFAGDQGKPVANPGIQSGHLEESNVNALGEMVKLIQGMRTYESAQKLIQAFDRMTEVTIQDVGRVL
jgi:flagellar basal-body rod protein FlgG